MITWVADCRVAALLAMTGGQSVLARFYILCYNSLGAWNVRWRFQYAVGGGPLIRIALEEAYFLIKASSFLRGGEYVW